jgi:GGDEF domain-containing protein
MRSFEHPNDRPAPQQTALTPAPGTSWLAVAAMLTDLAFETDAMGHFTAFGPGKVLGQAASDLLGVEAATLLAGTAEEEALSVTQFRSVITTICMECVAWHGKVRLTLPSGSGIFRLSLAPRIVGGVVIGTFGILFDLDTPELTLPDRHAGRADDPAWNHNGMLDAETGLWSARTFGEEITRRFDRLDVDDQPGMLLFIGFSRTTGKLVSPTAMRIAEELRDVVRATDLLGRIDATTIALWCDGMDHLAGGERAAKLCATLPATLPERSIITVGVAPRFPGSGDDLTAVIDRAAVTLRLADITVERADPASGGAWRVWQRD